MIKAKQLWIPGTKPSYIEPFDNYHKCGDLDADNKTYPLDTSQTNCRRSAGLLAIYFIMGNYNEDDGKPELVGFDCPFDDSNQLFACCPSHLVELIKQIVNTTDWGDIAGTTPEIVVNSKGKIEKNVCSYIFEEIGKPVISPTFSRGRETVDKFWNREKHHFGF